MKSTIAQVLVLISSGATAAGFSTHLDSHNVSAAVTIPVIAFTLSVGLQVAGDLGKAISTTVYRCPTKACTVTIRAPKTVGQDALDRYRQMATDHANHAEAGTR